LPATTMVRDGGAIVEPYLRQEYSEQSEQDREADHDEGTCTHAMSPE